MNTAAIASGAYTGFVSAGSSVTGALSLADGAVSGYEIATGDTIGDGTLSGILNVASITTSAGPRVLDRNASRFARVGSGLRIASSAGSLVNTGDPDTQRALRSISIASSVWQTGSTVLRTAQIAERRNAERQAAQRRLHAEAASGQSPAQNAGMFSVGDPHPRRRGGSFLDREDWLDDGRLNGSNIPRATANSPVVTHITPRRDRLGEYVASLFPGDIADPSAVFGNPSSPWLTESFIPEYERELNLRETFTAAMQNAFGTIIGNAYAEGRSLYEWAADPTGAFYDFNAYESAAALEQWAADSHFSVAGQATVALGAGLMRSGFDFGASTVIGGQTLLTDPALVVDSVVNGVSERVGDAYDFARGNAASFGNGVGLFTAELTGLNGIADFAEGRDISGNALPYNVADQRGADGLLGFLEFLDIAGTASAGAWKLGSKANRFLVNRYQPNVVGSNFGNLGVPAPNSVGKRLLPGEGAVGTYDDLIAAGSKGDNITPHHIPSANHMKQHGVSKGDGISINMEHPHLGSGGRHRQTFTYGSRADQALSPRDALGRGVRDTKRIYEQEGLYGPDIRRALQDLIEQNRRANPRLFD